MNQHLKECSHCRQEYDHFKEKVFAAQVFIPRPAMDRELKETFEREMHELLDQLGISEKNFNKKRIVLKFSQLNKMGEEIIKILIQPRMMMSFGIAGLLFYLMKRLTKIN